MSALLITALLATAVAPVVQSQTNGSRFLATIEARGFQSVTLSYEAEFQSDVLTVHDEAASDDALSCAALKIEGSGFLMFFEADYLAARYSEVSVRLYQPRAMARSRSWLAERGLLAKVPEFVASGVSEFAFARKLESICGPAAAGALGGNSNAHQFNYDFLVQAQNDEKKRNAFECIMHVSVVSGFGLGFVGNEAFQ